MKQENTKKQNKENRKQCDINKKINKLIKAKNHKTESKRKNTKIHKFIKHQELR